MTNDQRPTTNDQRPTTTLWSGRFAGEPDAAAFEFGRSFRFDRRLFEDDVTGSIAWARALSRAGVLAPDEARRIEQELAALLERGRSHPASVDGPDEDVHSFVERLLVERLGDLGRRLHTGRSRNEQVSVDLRLYLRRRIPLLQRAIAGVVEALLGQASAAGDGLMPSFTHLRPAQPVLVAHFFLAHVAALRRDHARFTWAAGEADAMPLGSGAVAGTNYAIDPVKLAGSLGFSKVVSNSIDASSDRDFVAAFLHACALTFVHLSRLSEDLIIFCGDEHGFFQLSDASSTGSSMMPQKKNPDPLELIRGKTGRIIGHLTGWLATLKGLPSGYNKDLQEDKQAVFDAEPRPRQPGCCWRLMWQIIWSPGEWRSGRLTKWWAAWCASSRRPAAISPRCRLRSGGGTATCSMKTYGRQSPRRPRCAREKRRNRRRLRQWMRR